MKIDTKDIKVRKDWGKVRPGTIVFKNRKKEKDRRACRGRIRP